MERAFKVPQTAVRKPVSRRGRLKREPPRPCKLRGGEGGKENRIAALGSRLLPFPSTLLALVTFALSLSLLRPLSRSPYVKGLFGKRAFYTRRLRLAAISPRQTSSERAGSVLNLSVLRCAILANRSLDISRILRFLEPSWLFFAREWNTLSDGSGSVSVGIPGRIIDARLPGTERLRRGTRLSGIKKPFFSSAEKRTDSFCPLAPFFGPFLGFLRVSSLLDLL